MISVYLLLDCCVVLTERYAWRQGVRGCRAMGTVMANALLPVVCGWVSTGTVCLMSTLGCLSVNSLP